MKYSFIKQSVEQALFNSLFYFELCNGFVELLKGTIFLVMAERNITKQATLLRDEMIFIHCSLQIKQNIYSTGIFRAPVVTQFIVKVQRKSPF